MNQVLCHPSISWRPLRFVGSRRSWQSRDSDQQSFMCSWHWSWPGMGGIVDETTVARCARMLREAELLPEARVIAERSWEATAAQRRLPSWILLFYAVNTKYSRQPINPLQLWQVAIFNAGSRLRSSHECGVQSLALSLSLFRCNLPKCVGSEGPVRFELRLRLRLRLRLGLSVPFRCQKQ